MGVMKMLGQAGDTRITWDPEDADQVDKAKRRFDQMIGRDKWRAWRMDDTGKKGEPITEFDPNAAAIIVAAPMAGG